MVPVLVAGGAHQRRILKPHGAVAFLACRDGVVSDQRKSRDVMIEGCDAAPFVLAMASLAANAKLTVVRIVGAMARDTRSRQLVAVEIAGVARIALDLRMGGPEWKFRVLVVTKADRGPLVLLVAGSTLGAVPSAVDVLNPVAIHAPGADSLVAFANMARGARDIAVRTLQRKPGLIVIKRFCAIPCDFAMTIVARWPKTPLMRIICLVTIEAAPGGVAKLDILCVTAVAWHSLVGVPKLEIRGRVIECLSVKQDDVSISALVIGVTMGAFLLRRIGLTPVKSLERLAVGSGFFVACQAQSRLRLS
jgi:hypothetical protein